MIPLRISLKNFLCYRDNVPPISLEGISLACLCGDNGAGKSALLEALTWALWGKARGKGDEELVHTGEREMEVELEFQAGERYRVIRKYLKAQPPQRSGSRLELQLVTPQGFRSLNGNNLRETQRILERNILHMDYDTFINSAFLLQGRADEFTNKTPGERKEVLGRILSLTTYDELAERAKAHREERKREKEKLEQAIAHMEQEIARKPQYQREAGEIRTLLAQLKGEVVAKGGEIDGLRQRKERLKLKQQRLGEMEGELKRVKGELESRQREVDQLHRQLQEYQGTVGQQEEIERGHHALLQAKEEEGRWREKLWRLQPLEAKKSSLDKAIQQARSGLEKESELLQHRLTDLKARWARVPQVEEELSLLQGKLAKLGEEEARLGELKLQEQTCLQQIQQLKALAGQRGEGKEELARKLALLEAGEASCPLCGAELGVEGVLRLQAGFREESQNLAQALALAEAKMGENQKQHQNLKREIGELEIRLKREQGSLQGRLGALAREREEARKAGEGFFQVEVEQGGIADRLRLGQFALMEQKELAEVAAEIGSLGYSREQHEQAQLRLGKWQGYEGKKARLEEALRFLPTLSASRERAEQAAQSLLTQLQQKEKEAKETREELVQLPQLEIELAAREQAWRAIQDRHEEAQRHLGGVEGKIDYCLCLEVERDRQEQERQRAMEEMGIYEELVEALGKRGVQALLIEQALPQLQEEADRLVKKLSDNRMSLNFKTQKETKKGETSETLDIEIGDELGTRSYEMYSGGEAFRVNFALRVALARLVSYRAGAPLPLLIIDEGFGTQDAQGQQRLVEAIRAISEEFDQVLVVTHVEELKEQFPVRLEVTKTEAGSMVQVIA